MAGRGGTVALVLASAMPGQGLAHPHIFIDTGLDVVIDADRRATAVRVAWVYDEFYSLVMIQDLGLDPDGDGTLTAEETTRLTGFDMNWDVDFAGDLYVAAGGEEMGLGRPQQVTARYRDGRIITTHLRLLDAPVAVADRPLTIQVYDPGYYTAYTILGQPILSGPGAAACRVEVSAPDLSAADQALRDALAEYSADQSLEADFPAVGANYAEEARVTCP